VSKWLNAAFAARVLLSDITFLTPTVKQTELGSLTFVRLRQLLTELILQFPFAPVAFVQARLSALNFIKLNEVALLRDRSEPSHFFLFIVLLSTERS
jgi:hypothetical protein